MKLKTYIAGLALAITLPFSAHAATVMVDGGMYNVSSDSQFTFAEETINSGGDDYFTFRFDSGGAPGAVAFNLIFDPIGFNIASFTATWSSEANGGGTVYKSETVAGTYPATGIYDFQTSFDVGDPQWLSVTWTTTDQERALAEVNVEVAPVPVPAAGFLLLGGLGGLVAMKRRKKA